MRVLRSTVVTTFILVGLFPTAAAARAAVVTHEHHGGQKAIALPADLDGELLGVPYRIRVPANWNGTLLVFAHATRNSIAPIPAAPEISPLPYPKPDVPFEEQLLALGYALAGAEFASTEKDGVLVTHALTMHFYGAVGRPDRVIVWGSSLGGVIATMLAETFPGIYDGALANGSPLAGSRMNIDAALAFALAYDVTFGWPTDVWGPIEDVRDDLTLADVLPVAKLPGPPDRYSRWEFIRLVVKLPAQAFWGVDPQYGTRFLGAQLWRATEVRARLETQYGGPVASNVGHVYTLTDEEKAYLAGLGLTNADALLAQMNARTDITGRRSARVRMEIWSPQGWLRRPVITMHSTFDGTARTANEDAFLEKVERFRRTDRLVQVFTALPGHGSFSTTQLLDVLAAMEHWLDTGEKPNPTLFPAERGFVPGYVPPPWPW